LFNDESKEIIESNMNFKSLRQFSNNCHEDKSILNSSLIIIQTFKKLSSLTSSYFHISSNILYTIFSLPNLQNKFSRADSKTSDFSYFLLLLFLILSIVAKKKKLFCTFRFQVYKVDQISKPQRVANLIKFSWISQ
jgi:hypothetical protein